MFELFRRLRRHPTPLAAPLWQGVRDAVPWVGALDDTRSQRLAGLTARFLHEKTLSTVGGLSLDDAQRAQLAATCCLPLLEFGVEGLHGWSELIVYPDAFRVRRHHVDPAGVVHEGDDALIGESWDAGPLILSWADVQSDCETPRSGFCVAVHEMAHKLDALDGEMDGTPPLPRNWQRSWARDFQLAFDNLTRQLDAGQDSDIDPYAAEAPEEFFAVASEYHFSDPALLAKAMPEVAAHLTRFYGPSPFA